MTNRFLPLAIASVIVAALIAAPSADAQGNGRPKGPKNKPNAPSAPSPSPSPAPSPSPTPTATATPTGTDSVTIEPTSAALTSVFSFRQFGTWLDDTSAMGRGEGSTSIGIGYWRMADTSQTNAPMLGAALGITDRIQVNASVPFYRVNYQGTTYSGMDDVYIGAKYTLVDPTLTVSEFGLAISPVMEILSSGATDGRVHFAIPVNLELRREPMRFYGSAGYFTRGSVFSGAAVEWATPARVVVTGALTQAYSIKQDAALDSLAIGKQRLDVMGSVAYPLGNVAAAFMSIGRSLSSIEEGGTKLALTGGVSFRFSAAGSTP